MPADQIKKYSKIQDAALSQEFYFQSLLQEAYAKAELTGSELESIQLQCISLLAASTERYNKGRSSSVRVEAAQAIMASNLFTVGVYLKTLPDGSSALDAVRTEPVLELYRRGRAAIDAKLSLARQLYELVRKTRIQSPNYTYTATADEGIEPFFRQYNPDFEAHEAPGSIDYQLLNPVTGLAGVEYMVQYLQNLYMENLFCSRFDATVIHEVMRGYDEGYEDLLVNIFGQVLQNALGCALLGKDIFPLSLGPSDVASLKDVFRGRTRESVCSLLANAVDSVLMALSIRGEAVKEYIDASIPEIRSGIRSAVETNTLHTVFVPRRSHDATRVIRYSTGSKMDAEAYREVVKELLACQDSRDKVRIISQRIKTLSDMEDVVGDAELTEAEALAVFRTLDDVEIAAMVKRHPYSEGMDALGYSGSEMRLRQYLDAYLRSMPEGRRKRLREAASRIEEA